MSGRCILMYHGIRDDDRPQPLGTDDPAYTVSADRFAAQLDYLRDARITGTSVAGSLSGPRTACVALSFDDGNASDSRIALPALQARGFCATFYITTAWIGEPGFMTEDEIRQLSLAGMEIGSHGHSHSYFDELSSAALADELRTSVSILERITGRPVHALGLPGGRSHRELRKAATAAGIRSIATSRPGMLRMNPDAGSLPRMAIQGATTLAEFRRIVCGDARYYFTQRSRKAVLDGAKGILGNARYEQLRRLFVSG